MFNVDSLNRLAGIRSGGKRAVVYARASSVKEKRDGNWDRQRERLLYVGQGQGCKVVEVITERAAGINERRRGPHRVFRLTEAGRIDAELAEFGDRLAGFGY